MTDTKVALVGWYVGLLAESIPMNFFVWFECFMRTASVSLNGN
jgi:hypothetical protein